jgi:hypothetical protein
MIATLVNTLSDGSLLINRSFVCILSPFCAILVVFAVISSSPCRAVFTRLLLKYRPKVRSGRVFGARGLYLASKRSWRHYTMAVLHRNSLVSYSPANQAPNFKLLAKSAGVKERGVFRTRLPLSALNPTHSAALR